MARILYVWELGDNYGHMSSFAGVAPVLKQRGHEIVIAVQNLSEAWKFFDSVDARYIQAPVWRKKQVLQQRLAITYADLIRPSGYTDVHGLTTMLKAWREVFSAVNPDLVAFDSAPTALLAARGLGLKTISYGDGYNIPPITNPLPNLQSWHAVDPAIIAQREKEILDVINIAAPKLGIKPLAYLSELFKTDQYCLMTFPELDHYPGRENTEYVGTVFSMDTGHRMSWPEVYEKRIFAYIRPDSKFFGLLIEQLKSYPANIIIFAPGVGAKFIEKHQVPHIHFSVEPVLISQMREESDIAICHAGHGTVTAFLLAGVPLVLFPNHLEQLLVALNAVRLGAAIIPKPGIKEIPLTPMINKVLSAPQFKQNAMAFAKKYQHFNLEAQAKTIANRFEQVL